MSVSPFHQSMLAGLLGDPEVSALFSVEAELDCLVAFEEALAEAEGAEGVIPAEAGRAIAEHADQVELDHGALAAATARDGVVVPELVRQLREGIGERHGAHVHFAATSLDAIDTGLALRLQRLSYILGDRIDALVGDLDALEARFGSTRVMAHTRMQAAIPVTATRKILSWRDPLVRHRARLETAIADIAILHFGGAAGTLDKLGKESVTVERRMAQRLGLRKVDRPRHSERDGIVAYSGWLAGLTGSLGKMGQDIALMAQTEMGEVVLSAGGGSSAMPHKVNPVAAETLVALARFNATLASGMQHAMVHENERSGAAWMLEWMLLPQMAVAAGTALATARSLVASIAFRATVD